MLTDKDIKKIVNAQRKVFATKEDLKRFAIKEDLKAFATKEDLSRFSDAALEVFATKEDLKRTEENLREEMRRNSAELLTAVDAYAKKADTYFQEMLVLAHKVDRHEKWIRQIAEKLGVKLEY
jgi:hypothetical protein